MTFSVGVMVPGIGSSCDDVQRLKTCTTGNVNSNPPGPQGCPAQRGL